MKFWEYVTVVGKDHKYQEVECYEQPLHRHLFALFTDWLWFRVVGICPWVLAEHDKKIWGWRLRYELWSGYENSRYKRRDVHRFEVEESDDAD
jgi:hypothetical protein